MASGEDRSAREGPARSEEGSGLLRRLNQLVLVLLIAGTASLFLKPSDDAGILGLPQLSVGQIPPRTIKAPRDFAIADAETTARLREAAVKGVLPTYDLRSSMGVEAKSRVEHAFAEVSSAAPVPASPEIARSGPPPTPPRELLEAFMRQLQVYLEPRELEVVVRGGFDEAVRDATVMVVRTIHEKQIVEDRDFLRLQAPAGIQVRTLDEAGRQQREDVATSYDAVLGLDQARAAVDELVSRELGHLPERSRRSVALLAKRTLRANLVFDRAETEARRARTAAMLQPVVIALKRNDVIISANEPVTERQILVLHELTRIIGAESRFELPLGSALLVTVLVVVGYLFARRRSVFRTHRDLVLGASLVLITLLTAWSWYKAMAGLDEQLRLEPTRLWCYAAPLSASAIVARIVISRHAAAALAPIAAVLCGFVMDAELGFATYVLVGSWTSALVAGDPERPRSSLLWAGLVSGAMQGLVLVALSLLESRFAVDMLGVGLALGLCSGLGSAVLAGLLIPLADILLGYPSPFHLLRLGSLNHPLLRELLVHAPGTYHHSIVVGLLADAGARAIGANPVLARVGGYYHDVGKLKSPRLFAENARNQRRTDESSAWADESLSLVEEAEAAVRHTRDGQDFVVKHRLGPVVAEIVATHHGNGQLRRLSRRFGEIGTVPPGLPQSYRDDPPATREAVVVALADAVESHVDALVAEGPVDDETLRHAVATSVREFQDDGLLVAAEITPRELAAVQDAIFRALRQHMARGAGGRISTPGARASSLYVVPTARSDRPN